MGISIRRVRGQVIMGFSRGNMLRLGVCMIPTGGSGAVAGLGLGYCGGTVLCYVPYRTCATGRH